MIYEFNLLKPYANRVRHGITQKSFGSLNDNEAGFQENVSRLAEMLDGRQPVYADQVHGDTILEIETPVKQKPSCDAFITKMPQIPMMVKVADCQGVLIYDKAQHIAACVHSGWRGSALNIIGKTLKQLIAEYQSKPEDLLVGISPSLGPCCAQFSDPFSELPPFCQAFFEKDNRVDFWRLSLSQCLKFGIPIQNIEIAQQCSKCLPDYYSHREGDSGRMGVFIELGVHRNI
jgi:hypothetical protein